MKRCVIITAYIEGDAAEIAALRPEDYVICADGGLTAAERSGIMPDLVLGDFDSVASVPDKYNFKKYPKEKDDTDTLLCVKHGIELGYSDFLIVGGLGGRLDHTLANLQTLAYAEQKDCRAVIESRDVSARIVSGGKVSIRKKDGFFISLLSYSEECIGVCISGVKYPLCNARLCNTFPIGVSNEFCDDYAEVSVEHGMLLILVTRAD